MKALVRRREFITLLGGAAAAWPLAARAQQPAMPVIGFLYDSAEQPDSFWSPFLNALSKEGFVAGRNVALEHRYAHGDYGRLPALAADLANHHVAVIVTSGLPSSLAAKNATSIVPIVFLTGTDPVRAGLVPSFNRPAGNVTGISQFSSQLGAKRLELLNDMIPKPTAIALLVNPSNPTSVWVTADMQTAASTTGQQLTVLKASNQAEVEAAFESVVRQRIGGLFVAGDGALSLQRNSIVASADRFGVPTVYTQRAYTMAGGLMSYSPVLSDSLYQLGVYVGRILKGEKSTDLPVMQPTKFELVVNLKAAKKIGLTIRETFLVRADEVIE